MTQEGFAVFFMLFLIGATIWAAYECSNAPELPGEKTKIKAYNEEEIRQLLQKIDYVLRGEK